MLRTSKMGKFVYWAPRVLAISFALFLSLFALDVFVKGTPFWTTVGALLMHLIPTFILLLVIWAAWKHSTAGGWMFMILGLIFAIMVGERETSFLSYIVLTGPVFLTGLLFFLNKQLQD